MFKVSPGALLHEECAIAVRDGNCFARTFSVIEVCERNMLSKFLPESKASVLTGRTTKSATNLMFDSGRCSPFKRMHVAGARYASGEIH